MEAMLCLDLYILLCVTSGPTDVRMYGNPTKVVTLKMTTVKWVEFMMGYFRGPETKCNSRGLFSWSRENKCNSQRVIFVVQNFLNFCNGLISWSRKNK